MVASTSAPPPSALTALWHKIVPPADRPPPPGMSGWHVSPVVDIAAYHLSWLWILVPLALAGDLHPKDYLGLWAFGMSLSFLHRHYTMPYVYLDKQVFQQHVTRFTLFPALLMLGFLASVFLFRWRAPAGFFRPIDVALVLAGLALVAQCVVVDRRGHRFRPLTLVIVAVPYVVAVALGIAGIFTAHHLLVAALVLVGFAAASVRVFRDVAANEGSPAREKAWVFAIVVLVIAACGAVLTAVADAPLNGSKVKGRDLVGAVGLFAAVWNVWHTLMQKFGILRVYAAKSAVPLEKRTPPWVDKLLLFGSFPFLALWIGPAQRAVIEGQAKSVTQYVLPVIDVLEVVQPFLLPPAGALALFAIGCFVWHEWRADRLRCTPRLMMAASLTALNLCFLFLSPLKVYIAYGFSHAIEYMVFVWAFLRRRYAQPQQHRPLIQRVLGRPLLAYGVFTLGIAVTFFLVEYGDDFGLHKGGITFFDVRLGTWLFSFAIWHSLAHFYFDGFLWKMRAASVRASL